MIRLGIVQAPAGERIEAYVSEARRRGCAAVCFPECALTGYDPERAAEKAVPADSPVIRRVSELAEDCGTDLLAGFMERDGEELYLTQGLFRADGSRDFYRKTHLGRKEGRFFTPGGELKVFELSCGLTVGVQLCVETHFPEITQTLALKGAEVIFAPHAVPRAAGSRRDIWERFIPARSYDNRVYMACCNLWDEARFGGGCMVTGPEGRVEAACWEDAPALVTFEADRQIVADLRKKRFYPRQRRPELYFR